MCHKRITYTDYLALERKLRQLHVERDKLAAIEAWHLALPLLVSAAR